MVPARVVICTFFFILGAASLSRAEDGAGSDALSTADDKLKYESLFFTSQIRYFGPGELKVSDSWLPWGKWVEYPNGRVDQPVEVDRPDGKTLKQGGLLKINAAGRASSPSGTEGAFRLAYEGKTAVHVYFDIPVFGSNNIVVDERDEKRFKFDWYRISRRLPLNITYIGSEASSDTLLKLE